MKNNFLLIYKILFFLSIKIDFIFYSNKINAQASTSLVGFYNCENLFDTINNLGTKDGEYIPSSKKHWNTTKYLHKLQQLSRAILAMGDRWSGPDIIGLCEVENKKVINDLIQKTYLRQYDYRIIHQESTDERGIDVAMMYKASVFEVISYDYIRIPLKEYHRPTRDILYVKGCLRKKDTLHLFFNHWPSRFGGMIVSKEKRITAGRTLRKYIDTIFQQNKKAFILIAGDFNDHSMSESIQKHLKAHTTLHDSLRTPFLFNTSYALKKEKDKGTYKYKGRWDIFDQWIVSDALLNTKSHVSLDQKKSFILQKKWLLHDDNENFEQKPFRSYRGDAYIGGFSDHLPIYIKLRIK